MHHMTNDIAFQTKVCVLSQKTALRIALVPRKLHSNSKVTGSVEILSSQTVMIFGL